MDNSEDKKWLYDKLKANGLGISYKDFENTLGNEEDLKWYYDRANGIGLQVGSYDDFSTLFSSKPAVSVAKQVIDEYDASMGNARSQGETNTQPSPSPTPAQPNMYDGSQFAQAFQAPDWRSEETKLMDEIATSGKATVATLDGVGRYPTKPFEVKYDESVREAASNATSQKQSAADQLNSLYDDINKQVDAIPRRVPRPYEAMAGLTDQQLEENRLRAAQRIVEDAKEVLEEAGKKGNTNFVAGLGRGIADKIADPENWNFGITDLADNKYLLDALKKSEKGEELTPAEDKLLQAATTSMAVNYYYSQDLGRGYKAGKTTAESIPFMLEFMINPVSASGSGIAKSLLKYGMKKFGAKAVNRGITRAAGRLIGDAAAAAGMTATIGAARTLASSYEKQAENYDYRYDDTGNVVVQKKGDMGQGEALARGFLSNFLENQSEMVFGAFSGAGKSLSGIIPSIGKLSNSGLVRFYNSIKNAPLAKQLRDRAKIGGVVEEYAEEVYNNFANVAIGEMSAEDALSIDNNIDTFLGLVPTQLAFSAIGLGGLARENMAARKRIRAFEAGLSEEEKNVLTQLQDAVRSGDNNVARDYIKATLADNNLTDQEKKERVFAARDIVTSQQAEKVEQEQTSTEQETDASYAEGASADPSTYHERYKASQQAGAALEQVDPSLYDTINRYVEDDASAGEVDNLLSGLEGETEQLARTYLNSLMQLKGAEDSQMQDAVEAVDAFDQSVQPYAYQNEDGTRSITTGTYKERPVYVIPGDGGNVTVVYEDGSREMALSQYVEGQETTDYDEFIDNYSSNYLQEKETAFRQSLENHPKTQQPAPGVVLHNGDMTYVVTNVSEDGYVDIVPATYDAETGQTVPKNGEAQQTISYSTAMMLQNDYYNALDNQGNTSINTGNSSNLSENKAENESRPSDGESNVLETTVEDTPEQRLANFIATLPKKGKTEEIDYNAMTPQQRYEYTSLIESTEIAAEDLQADIAAKQKQLEAVQKKLESAVGGKRTEIRDQMRKLRNELKELTDYYQSIATPVQQEQVVQEVASQEQVETSQSLDDAVPDVVNDKASDARQRGYRMVNGQRVDRQEQIPMQQGRETDVRFSQNDTAKAKFAIVDATYLQPSHIGGVRNSLFFIDEAQPKDRVDNASVMAADRMARDIRPEEITGGVTAYTGSPVINSRGEVIQGNNRSAALRIMYQIPGADATYRDYLNQHAEDFGLTAEQINSIQSPVLVRVADVTDNEAIRLGQMTAQDTESGGIERIKPTQTATKLGDSLQSFNRILLNSQEEDVSLSDLVSENGVQALKFLRQQGSISDTQYQSAFDANGNLTPEAKQDLIAILQTSLFEGGPDLLPQMFRALPAKAQKAILSTFVRDEQSPEESRIKKDIQNAIQAFYAAMQFPDFAKATNYESARNAIEQWKRQINMIDGVAPMQVFDNFALELAVRFKGYTMKRITDEFNAYYDLVQGAGADLFSETASPVERGEAIRRIFNIQTNEQEGNDAVGSDNTGSEEGRSGSTGSSAGRERNQDEGGSSDTGRGTETTDGSEQQVKTSLSESPESANERRMNQIIERLDEIEYRLSELEGKTDIFSEAEQITLNNEKNELESEFEGLRKINATSAAIQEEEDNNNILYRSDDTLYRIRESDPPINKGIGYKVFVLKNGKLYPPMVANPNGEETPVGVWLDADAAPIAGQSKTGRNQVKAGGKGTQGGSGKLAYRPGWHLGEIPYALQFNRIDENGNKELFPANFVWAEVEYANDVDYQEEAMSYGINSNGKFQHSLAGLPRIPVNGSYRYRTNPNPETDPWIITGAMKVKRLLTPTEVDNMVKLAGKKPQKRQKGFITDKEIEELNNKNLLIEREGQGLQTDASVSLANDPASRIAGAPRRSRKQQEEYAARERRRMENAANRMVEKLGLDNVEIVTDASTLEGDKSKAKGFYSPSTGKITIVLPNHVSSFDVEQTILHEAVAHYGLRRLFGDNFGTFLDNVYNNASAEIRERINKLAKKYNGNYRTATEEYLASLAENTDFENAVNSGWFNKIKSFFLKMLSKAGINIPELTDNELRYILWRSYENLAHPGHYRNVFDTAADVAKQNELKVGNYAESKLAPDVAAENDVLFRTSSVEDLLEDWHIYVSNGPNIHLINNEEDIDRLPYSRFTKIELKEKLKNKRCTGGYSNRNGAIFLFPDHMYGDTEELELTIWHETAHYASRQLGLDERLKNSCLDYIKNRYPDIYKEITSYYDRSRWSEEAVAYLFERKIKEFGAKKLLSSTFAGESDIAETFTKLINFIKNGKGNTESGRNSGSTGNTSGKNTERSVFGGRGNDLLDERRKIEGGETEGEGTTPLSSETVKAWDKLASSNRFLLRETAVDYLTAVEKFQDFIAKVSKKAIKDYENIYQSLLALSSRNKAEMDAFDSSIVKPLNEAILKLTGKKKGFKKWNWDKGPLRDLVMYVYSKHGVERNRQVAIEKFIKSYQFDSFKNIMKLGVPFDMQSYVKELNEVKNKAKKDAYEKAYNKHLQKYIDKGIDEKEASEKAKKAAKKDASNAMRKASRDFRSKVKLRLESEAKELLARQWEEKKSEIGQMNVPWAEKQTMLDEEAALIGADITKDYSGLSSMFKDKKWIDLSREYVAKYENSHSSENINGLWAAIKNATDFALYKQYKSGLVSEEYVKNQQKRFDNYIPLRGFKDKIAGDVYNYIGKEYRIGNPVKSMRGRGSEADNPFGSILQIAYSSISSGNKNTAKQRLMNLVLNHNTDNLTVVNRAWKVKEDVLDEYRDLLVIPSNKEEEQDDNDTEWVEAVAKIPEGASPKEIEEIMIRFGEAMSKLKAEGRAEEIRKGSKIAYRTLYDERSSHQIPLYVGGEKYIITITGNPRLAQAVNGELNPESESGWLAESGKRVNRTMAGLLTAKNAAFSLSNLSKDTIDANNQAFIKENPKWWWEFTKNQRAGFGLYPQMMKYLKMYNEGKMDTTDKNQALFKEFMDYGGATGYTFVETQKEYAEKLSKELNKLSSSNPSMLSPKWVYKTVFDAIEFAGQSAEIVNRFAAYKTSREMGRSITRSVSDAKEITVNFNRKGAGKKTAGKNTNTLINIAASISEYGRNSIIFWNANMQGKYRLYKNLKEHPVKTSATLVGNTMAIGGVLLPLLNNLVLPALYSAFGLGSDDDDVDYFDALTDWERTHNLCVRLPKGDWLKVPIAPDMAPWLTMGDVIGAQVAGKREADWTDFAKVIIDATSPFSINWSYEGPAFFINFAPSISEPLLQNMTNTNFMGNPIAKKPYSNRQAFDPKFKQVFRTTSPTLVELSRAVNSIGGGNDVQASGKMTDWNPAYIQNLVSGYTGGYGMTFISIADFITSTLKGESPEAAIGNFPIVDRFYISGTKDMKLRRVNSSYYDVKDFIDKMKHDVKGYEDEFEKAQKSGNVEKMAEYNMEKNNLMNSKDFSKLNELENLDKQIRDYEKYLKEFPEDEKVQKMVYDAKRRALEIMDEK